MRAFISFVVMAAAIALLPACKKDKAAGFSQTLTVVPPSYPSYSQLKPGNYWVYDYYNVQQDGVAELTSQHDSCYVEKDTLIHGAVFFKMHQRDFIYNTGQAYYYRDSLHYIVNEHGTILFSSQDFSTVFSSGYDIGPSMDTLYKYSSKMNDKDLVIQVPAGSFTTSNMQTTFVAYPMFINSAIDNPRYMNTRYAKGVGLVSETQPMYSGANYVTEKRLVRYHLN